MSGISGPKIITSGCVLSLDAADKLSYKGSGTSWRDLSGNNNIATLNNGPTFSAANMGSILFDGTNDYATIPNSSIFYAQNLTISAWVKFNGFSAYNCIISKAQNGPPWSSPFLSWLLRINSNNTLEFSIGSASTYHQTATSYSFSTGVIYNIVSTYNGSNMISYINTSLINSSNIVATINYTTNDVLIGADQGGVPAGEYISGNIYMTSFYNRALSASEVLQNYNATKNRFGR